jgi:5-methylcytosine-specific restriction endonuclease McrA
MTPLLDPTKIRKEQFNPVRKIKRRHNSPYRQHLIQRLGNANGFKCWFCGADVSQNASRKPSLEHLVPLAKGGTNHDTNMGLSCDVCNRAKGDMTVPEYLAWLHGPKSSIYAIPISQK